MKGIAGTSRNSSHTKEFTETSSQRSCKIIRANGLRLVEKPKINKERVIGQSPMNSAKGFDPVGKAYERSCEL
jgi:hypothetical protein